MTEHGHVERPYLGVGLVNLNKYLHNMYNIFPNQLKVASWLQLLTQNSAAGKAGLKEEDIITKMNDTEVKNSTELRKLLIYRTKSRR